LNEQDQLVIRLTTNIAPKVGIISIRCSGTLRMIIPGNDIEIELFGEGGYGMQIPCAYSVSDRAKGQFIGDQIIVKLWAFKSAQEAKDAQRTGVEPAKKALVELRRDIRVQKSILFSNSQNKECSVRGNVQITRPPKKIIIVLSRPYLDGKIISRVGTGWQQEISNPITDITYRYFFTDLEENTKYELTTYSVYDEKDPFKYKIPIAIKDFNCLSVKDNTCTLLPTCTFK